MSWKSQWTFWAKIGFSWCHLLLDNSFVASLGLSSCCSNPRQNCKAWKLCSLIGESLAMSWGLRESVSVRERGRARFQSLEWVVARTVRPRTHFSTPSVGRLRVFFTRMAQTSILMFLGCLSMASRSSWTTSSPSTPLQENPFVQFVRRPWWKWKELIKHLI